ncbi:MAG: hypothetical protein ABF608_08190 [Sporolactobacillus sp.]
MKSFDSVKATAFLSAISLSGIISPLILSSLKHNMSHDQTEEDAIKKDWIKVGNDMRRGIINYDRSLTSKEK